MRTRFPALLTALALVALAACTAKPAATGSADDEQAIRGLAGKYAAAYAAKDTAAAGALVTEDYQDVDPLGAHTQGRAAFQSKLAQEFAMMGGAPMTMTAGTTYVRWIDANNAVAGGTWETPPMPGMPSKGSWMATVVKQANGTWQMSAALGAADVSGLMAPPDTTKKKP